MDNIKLLLVEDEAILAMIVKETLEKRGFEIVVANNGVEGWSFFNLNKPDICIVDIMMPRKDGLQLVRDIRQTDENTPVIFLTAKTSTEDVLKGFEAGADDYMKKPFSMEELIVRLKSLNRRKIRQTDTAALPIEGVTTIGKYTFNFHRLELADGRQTINLSQREAELLDLLLLYKNKLLDRRTALLKIWGDDTIFNARSMDVYVTRLRKYFQASPEIEILNVRGQGYKLID